MADRTLTLLQHKLHETYEIAPNYFGSSFVDSLFAQATRRLKTFPFKWYIPISLILAGISYLVIGLLIVRLATILQYGF